MKFHKKELNSKRYLKKIDLKTKSKKIQLKMFLELMSMLSFLNKSSTTFVWPFSEARCNAE